MEKVFEEAVIREIKEETSLDFSPVFFKLYQEKFLEFEWKSNLSVFYGDFSGKVKINSESSDFGWFSVEEIANMKIAYNHKKVIKDFLDSFS